MTKSIGLEVGPDFYKRFMKHKKTFVDPSLPDFVYHVNKGELVPQKQEPAPQKHEPILVPVQSKQDADAFHRKQEVESVQIKLDFGPGALTGDKLIHASGNSWRGVNNVEMDRVLASGPTTDPVIHRGLPNFSEEFC